ncbi:MAG: hypothetical protein KGH65_01780 [Candidatus Micrarchaeota archaeon]|nr:hypothetical protein [Candidatus Micrarchaeota archaeon]
MMEKLSKVTAVCYRCSSALATGELVKEALNLAKGVDFVQIFDNQKEIEQRLLPAYFNALIRYEEEGMRSREVSKEMLILVAGKMNISKAIEKCGVKDARDFILFATSGNLEKIAKKNLRIGAMKRIPLKFDQESAANVAITPIIES